MTEPRRVLFKVTYAIPVEFPTDWTDDMIRLELNTKCPGTGFVGAAFEEHLQKQEEESMCWACTLNAEWEIIDMNLKYPDPKPTAALSDEVRRLADDPARKIDAIKLYREQTGADLKESKDAVETYLN